MENVLLWMIRMRGVGSILTLIGAVVMFVNVGIVDRLDYVIFGGIMVLAGLALRIEDAVRYPAAPEG